MGIGYTTDIKEQHGVECNKGLAFDSVLSHLEQEEIGNVMYVGDSENDNPAFRKSDISIGIRSDARLNPMLDCKYMLDFNHYHYTERFNEQ